MIAGTETSFELLANPEELAHGQTRLNIAASGGGVIYAADFQLGLNEAERLVSLVTRGIAVASMKSGQGGGRDVD